MTFSFPFDMGLELGIPQPDRSSQYPFGLLMGNEFDRLGFERSFCESLAVSGLRSISVESSSAPSSSSSSELSVSSDRGGVSRTGSPSETSCAKIEVGKPTSIPKEVDIHILLNPRSLLILVPSSSTSSKSQRFPRAVNQLVGRRHLSKRHAWFQSHHFNLSFVKRLLKRPPLSIAPTSWSALDHDLKTIHKRRSDIGQMALTTLSTTIGLHIAGKPTMADDLAARYRGRRTQGRK